MRKSCLGGLQPRHESSALIGGEVDGVHTRSSGPAQRRWPRLCQRSGSLHRPSGAVPGRQPDCRGPARAGPRAAHATRPSQCVAGLGTCPKLGQAIRERSRSNSQGRGIRIRSQSQPGFAKRIRSSTQRNHRACHVTFMRLIGGRRPGRIARPLPAVPRSRDLGRAR